MYGEDQAASSGGAQGGYQDYSASSYTDYGRILIKIRFFHN